MAQADMAPNLGGDPMALVLLRLLAGRNAPGAGEPTPQAPAGATSPQSRPAVPAGMTQAGSTAPAPSGAPQPGPRSASPLGMTRPQRELTTPRGGVIAGPGTRPTPSNPASPMAVNPEKPEAPTLGDNKTGAAGETGNQPPGSLNAPVISERQYDQQNPLPDHTPYQEPSLEKRMLMGLFTGMMAAGGNREGANEMLMHYLDQNEKNLLAEKGYPAKAAATQHKGYMDYVKTQGDIAGAGQKNAQADADEALARKRGEVTLDQQYANAIEKGDQAAADRALAAIKNESAATARPTIETLSQRYADAVESGDTVKAEKLLAGLRALTKATTKTPANRTPSSEGGMAYADWRRENPHAPVSDYFKLKNSPRDEATQAKNLDSLRKEREQIARDYNAKITDIRTDPAEAKRLQAERDHELGTYDRQIHNFEQGYREGDVIPYAGTSSGFAKITRIRPDGMLEVVPAEAPKK